MIERKRGDCREEGRRAATPGRALHATSAAAACLFILLLLVLLPGMRRAQAQENPPPVPETPGEGVSQGSLVYFYLEGELAPVSREVAGGPQAVEFTIMELLNGPREEEKAEGYVTYIPEGVKLQYTTVKQDRSEFSVNFSRELLELAGDRDKAVKALAQLVKTVREASGIENIGLTVASEDSGVKPEDAFRALGVTTRMVEAEISGSPLEEGGHWWWVLIPALGIPFLALLALTVALLRKRSSDPEKVRPVVGTAARPTLRVKRRRTASPPTPAPWKEPGAKRRKRRWRREDKGR